MYKIEPGQNAPFISRNDVMDALGAYHKEHGIMPDCMHISTSLATNFTRWDRGEYDLTAEHVYRVGYGVFTSLSTLPKQMRIIVHLKPASGEHLRFGSRAVTLRNIEEARVEFINTQHAEPTALGLDPVDTEDFIFNILGGVELSEDAEVRFRNMAVAGGQSKTFAGLNGSERHEAAQAFIAHRSRSVADAIIEEMVRLRDSHD